MYVDMHVLACFVDYIFFVHAFVVLAILATNQTVEEEFYNFTTLEEPRYLRVISLSLGISFT